MVRCRWKEGLLTSCLEADDLTHHYILPKHHRPLVRMNYPDVTPVHIPGSTGNELRTNRVERDAVKTLRTLPASIREQAIDSYPGSKERKQLIRLNWDKDQGNDLFRQSKYEAAISKYKESIRHVLAFDPPIRDATCERYKSLAWVRILTRQ